jgi:hypothetical protein
MLSHTSASAYGHIPVSLFIQWVHVGVLNYAQVVQTLIERGCNFNAKNNDMFTPSDYAYSCVLHNSMVVT